MKIAFRCWYCNRPHEASKRAVGRQYDCSCERTIRVPAKSGGNCRVRTATDRLVEGLVYGAGGALLGLILGVGILAALKEAAAVLWPIPAALTLAGLFGGVFFGEAGVGWIGKTLRAGEDRRDLPDAD